MAGTFPTSPDADNLQIPTGILYFREEADETDGEHGFRDLGECPNFKLSPNVTTKEQKSSRGGTKKTLVKRVTDTTMTATFDLLEITPENIRYFAMGEITTDTDGSKQILGLSDAQISGTLRWIGDNDVGQRITWEGEATFTPSGDFNFVQDGDDYTKITLTADIQVNLDDGSFGVWNIRGIGG